MLFVMESCEPMAVLTSDGEDRKLLWIGFDERGLELEVIALELSEFILVIHVMPRSFRRRQ